jgi:hypothetical protein
MKEDPYAAAAETHALLHEGLQYRRDRAGAADMITAGEAATLVEVDGLTIENWIRQGKCLAVLDSDRVLRVPLWQFDTSLWPLIQRICECLGTKDPWQVLDFLETPAASLDGLTPRAALEQGMPVARVLAAATAESH